MTSITRGQTEEDADYDYDDDYEEESFEYEEEPDLGNEPSFDTPVRNVTVFAGDTVLLPCRVNNLGKYKVIWQNPNFTFLTYEDRYVFDDPRISLTRLVLQEWNLRIESVRREDDGSYRCSVNTNPVRSQFVHLFVKDASNDHNKSSTVDQSKSSFPAIPVFRPMPQNITVGPGDKAILKCRVENLGSKMLSWHKADHKHPLTIGLYTFAPDNRISADFNQRTNEWILLIDGAKPEDDGNYSCVISSKTLEQNAYQIRLNVKTVQVTGTEYVEQGGTIELHCYAYGRPLPPQDVEWYRNGERIQFDVLNDVRITKSIDSRVLESVLQIHNSKMADGGDYICRSSNHDTASIKVHILNVQAANVKRTASSSDKGAVAVAAKQGSGRNSSRQLHSVTTSHAFVMISCYVIFHLLFLLRHHAG